MSTAVLVHPRLSSRRRYDDLRRLGRIVKHEEARSAGVLHTCDTYEMLLDFMQRKTTLFVSQYIALRTQCCAALRLPEC